MLLVYGIFLDEHTRDAYGMHSPEYATVRDYATVAIGDGYIVEAVHMPDRGLCLTGLVVEVEPFTQIEGSDGNIYQLDNWDRLDRLEGGYDRKQVTTTDGQSVWMYVAK